MAFPADPLTVRVQIALGADLTADPSTWTWTDITSYVEMKPSGITITRGRQDRWTRAGASSATLTLNNADGRFARLNPFGAYYGQLARNTPLRIQVDPGTGYQTRFTGYVAKWPPSWSRVTTDHKVTITAAGIMRRLGKSATLRSPMYRTHSGVSANDLVPAHYLPLEEGADATFFAEVMNGTAVAVPSAVTPAADDTLAGSLPLPQFASGAHLSVVVPSYSPTTQWDLQFTVKMPDAKPASNVTLWEGAVSNAGGGVASMRLIIDITDALIDTVLSLQALDGSGAVVAAVGKSIDPLASISPADFYGSWRSIIVGMHPTGASYDIALALTETDITFNGYFNISTSGSVGVLRSYTLRNTGTQTVVFGHAALFAGSFDINTEATQNASSMLGHAGELVHTRIPRLCQQEQVNVTVSGTSTATMGPQPVATLLDALREGEDVDLGLLHESIDGKLRYLCNSSRYNAAASLTLDYGASEIHPPFAPEDDDSRLVNHVIASRPDGSSATSIDQDSIDAEGEYKLPHTANTETDGQLDDIAGWLRGLGTVDEYRIPAVTIELHSNPGLVTSWLACDIGSKVSLDNLPSPLPDSSSQIIEGYTEHLREKEWSATLSCSPASPYDIGVYGTHDDERGRVTSGNSTLSADITSSATSVSVDSGGDTWATTATHPAEFPFGVRVGGANGLVYECTAISGSAPSYTFTITRLATDRSWSAGTGIDVDDVDDVDDAARYGL